MHDFIRRMARLPLIELALDGAKKEIVKMIFGTFGLVAAFIAGRFSELDWGIVVVAAMLVVAVGFIGMAFLLDWLSSSVKKAPPALQARLHAFYYRWQGIEGHDAETVRQTALDAFMKEWCPICADIVVALGTRRFQFAVQPEPPTNWPERATISNAAERVTGMPNTKDAAERMVFWSAAAIAPRLCERPSQFRGIVEHEWARNWAIIFKNNHRHEDGLRTYHQPIEMVLNTFCTDSAKSG